MEKIIQTAKRCDIDDTQKAIRALARAQDVDFSLPAVEKWLRDNNTLVFLIAEKKEIEPQFTLMDYIGNIDREFVLSYRKQAKPRRPIEKKAWPASPEENMERLASAGNAHDRGVPMCAICDGKCSISSPLYSVH